MAEFDYSTEAELFPSRNRKSRRQPFAYRRFAQSSGRHPFCDRGAAVESLLGAYLEVDEERYDSARNSSLVRQHRLSLGAARVGDAQTCRQAMTDKTIDLDQHRGMAAQKATGLRRLLSEVEANERTLRLRQAELETHLVAAPAANWQEAAEKARYLLNLFANTLTAARSQETEADCGRSRRFREARTGLLAVVRGPLDQCQKVPDRRRALATSRRKI